MWARTWACTRGCHPGPSDRFVPNLLTRRSHPSNALRTCDSGSQLFSSWCAGKNGHFPMQGKRDNIHHAMPIVCADLANKWYKLQSVHQTEPESAFVPNLPSRCHLLSLYHRYVLKY